MAETRVTILNKYNEKLVGIISTPSIQQKKYATVILAHGFGSNKDESGLFSDIAKYLSKLGILVLRFDFSGCGESDGDYSDTSLSKLKSDLSSVFDFVQSHPMVDTSRIGLLGQSMGTSAIIALEPKVKCIVLMGATPHPKVALIKLFGEGYKPNDISTRIKPSGTITKIKSQFWKDFDNYNLIESLKNIHCPILFIHGETDDKVAISEMEEYFQNANEPKEKIIIEGANHGLQPHRDKAYDSITDCYNRYLI
jgi:fermentation-respiration switch protein FrsA (DUF1100 family)